MPYFVQQAFPRPTIPAMPVPTTVMPVQHDASSKRVPLSALLQYP
nr:MAG TPA: hypothetical protein [Caudoviricetes sp.]